MTTNGHRADVNEAAVQTVLKHSKSSGTDKLVLLAVAGLTYDPTIEELAHLANVTPRNVSKAIARLVDRGELVVHHRQGGNPADPPQWRPSRYEVTLTGATGRA